MRYLFKLEKSRSYSLDEDELKAFCDDVTLYHKGEFTITYREPKYFYDKKNETDDCDADNINTFRNSHAVEFKRIQEDPFVFVNTYIIFSDDFNDTKSILQKCKDLNA